MCYYVYLSTDSKQDLKCYNEELIYFEKIDKLNFAGIVKLDEITALLEYENKWYVGSSSGCGCNFRHLPALELGFGEPEDWFPEDEKNIEATKKLYQVMRKLIDEGHQVDCIDAWYDVKPKDIKKMDVRISNISNNTSFSSK